MSQAIMDFTAIYDEYYQRIFRYVRKHLSNLADTEDLTAEIFLAVYKYLPNYDSNRCPFAAWMYMIASSRLKNFYRDRKEVYALDNVDLEIGNGSIDYCSQAIEIMGNREILQHALEKLTEREREIIISKYFLNKDNSEIALALGLSQVNVRVISTRALKKLREIVSFESILEG